MVFLPPDGLRGTVVRVALLPSLPGRWIQVPLPPSSSSFYYFFLLSRGEEDESARKSLLPLFLDPPFQAGKGEEESGEKAIGAGARESEERRFEEGCSALSSQFLSSSLMYGMLHSLLPAPA